MATYEQALAILGETPNLLRTIVMASPAEALGWKPADDAWSTRDVLNHLYQAEAVISFRVRQMIEEDQPALGAPPAATPPTDVSTLLEGWAAARRENLAFLRALAPEQLQRTGRHRRYGLVSAREHIVEWAYHDLDHFRQILAAIQSGLYPDIGAFEALYPRPT